MKPAKLPLLLAPLLLASCGGPSSTLSREVIESSEPTSQESSVSSSSVYVSDLTEEQYSQIPMIYAQRMSQYKNYKAITKGSTKAKVLFIETEQSIDVTAIKGEYSYLKNESHSSLVNTVHEAYYHGTNAVYHDNDGDYQMSTMAEYLDKYGVDPFEVSIEGYLISDATVLKVEKKEAEQDYSFLISLDPEKATNNVRIQMKQFGELDDYPNFKRIDIALNIKNDFTPTTLLVEAEYDAKKVVGTDCTQNYTVTFSDFDQTIEIPGLSQIREKFDF